MEKEFDIQFDESRGSVWKQGDCIYGPEKDGTWMAMVCIEPRRFGPRGGLREPARHATITAKTWRGIRHGFERIGFRPPVRHRAG